MKTIPHHQKLVAEQCNLRWLEWRLLPEMIVPWIKDRKVRCLNLLPHKLKKVSLHNYLTAPENANSVNVSVIVGPVFHPLFQEHMELVGDTLRTHSLPSTLIASPIPSLVRTMFKALLQSNLTEEAEMSHRFKDKQGTITKEVCAALVSDTDSHLSLQCFPFV